MTTPMTPAEALEQWVADNPSFAGTPAKAETAFQEFQRQAAQTQQPTYAAGPASANGAPLPVPIQTSEEAAKAFLGEGVDQDPTTPKEIQGSEADVGTQFATVPVGVAAIVDESGNPNFGQQYRMTLKLIQDKYPNKFGSNAWYNAALKQQDFIQGLYVLQVLMNTSHDDYKNKNYMQWDEFLNQAGSTMIDEEKLNQGWNRYAALSQLSDPDINNLLQSGVLSREIYQNFVAHPGWQLNAALAKASHRHHPQFRTHATNHILKHYNNEFQIQLMDESNGTPRLLTGYLALGSPGMSEGGDKHNALKTWYVDNSGVTSAMGYYLAPQDTELSDASSNKALVGAGNSIDAAAAAGGEELPPAPAPAPALAPAPAPAPAPAQVPQQVQAPPPTADPVNFPSTEQMNEQMQAEFDQWQQGRVDPQGVIKPPGQGYEALPNLNPFAGFNPGFFDVDLSTLSPIPTVPPRSPAQSEYDNVFNQRFFDPANTQAARDAYRAQTGVTGSGGLSGIGRQANRALRGMLGTEQIPSFREFQQAFTAQQLANEGMFPHGQVRDFVGGGFFNMGGN